MRILLPRRFLVDAKVTVNEPTLWKGNDKKRRLLAAFLKDKPLTQLKASRTLGIAAIYFSTSGILPMLTLDQLV